MLSSPVSQEFLLIVQSFSSVPEDKIEFVRCGSNFGGKLLVCSFILFIKIINSPGPSCFAVVILHLGHQILDIHCQPSFVPWRSLVEHFWNLATFFPTGICKNMVFGEHERR